MIYGMKTEPIFEKNRYIIKNKDVSPTFRRIKMQRRKKQNESINLSRSIVG
jgi:hypothetical protein